MTTGPEYRLHCAVVDHLSAVLKPPTWFTSIEHGVKLPPATARRLNRIQVKAGIPDILIVHDGRCHWIELKAGRNGLQGAQIVVGAALGLAGCHPRVCRSIDDVGASLRLWGIPTREAKKVA